MTYWECQRECEKMIAVRGVVALVSGVLAALFSPWFGIITVFALIKMGHAMKVRQENADRKLGEL